MSVTIYKNANIDNQGLTSFAVENGKFIKFGKDVEQEYQDRSARRRQKESFRIRAATSRKAEDEENLRRAGRSVQKIL